MAAPFRAFAGVGHVLGGGDPLLAVPGSLAGGDPLLAQPVDTPPDAPVLRRPAAVVLQRPAARVLAGGDSLPVDAPPGRRQQSAAYKARVRVMRGQQKKTAGGLRPRDMWYSNHTGKVISMSKSLQSQQRYVGSKLAFWNRCTKEARRILGYHGRFIPIGGKTFEGQRLWTTAKALQRLHG